MRLRERYSLRHRVPALDQSDCSICYNYYLNNTVAKILAKGSYFVLGQKFHQLHKLPSGSSGWSLQAIGMCYAHMHVLTIVCAQIQCVKIAAEKIKE